MIQFNFRQTSWFEGRVSRGAGRGKRLGFPTVNLVSSAHFEFGVYACILKIRGQMMQGVMHYGPRLMFNQKTPLIEIHIFDFTEELYGQVVQFLPLVKIRGTQQFENQSELVEAVKSDISKAKLYFKNRT